MPNRNINTGSTITIGMSEPTILEMPSLRAITLARERLGWTQKQLGKRVGVGQMTISKIENGQYSPSYQTLKKIIQTLNEAMFGPPLFWSQIVKEIMTKPVIYLTPGDRVLNAIIMMEERGISQLPVIDKGKNVGTVTENMILMHALRPDDLIGSIAGPKMPLIEEISTLREVRRLLLYEPAVLIGEQSKIKGIMTKHDIFRIIREELDVIK
jgi:predicted transcriptional regulator